MIQNSNEDSSKITGNNDAAPLHIEKVRNVISQIKTHSGSLVHEGVDMNSLSDHITTIERELERPSPRHSRIRDALEHLQIGFGRMDQTLISSGALALLNQVLGTGVPS